MRIGVKADCGPVELLVEHVAFIGPNVAPDWPNDGGYEIEFDGEPTMRCRLVLGTRGKPPAPWAAGRQPCTPSARSRR